MNRATVKQVRQPEMIGQQVRVDGWVRTRRDSKGGFSFIELNDGSCLANIQIIADKDLPNYEDEIRALTAGCSVSIEGEVKESGGKQATEILASSLCVYGMADPESYPLQKKRHSFEKLREWAHLRPRTNTFGAVMRTRNAISRAIHQFFQDEEFLYVNTPIITASDCEGAGEMFKVTTLDLDKLAGADKAKLEYRFDFFDQPTFLTVSGQLQAEIFACSLGKVYTFGPTFRAENSNTSRHLAEFWMVEPEVAFYDLEDNMALAERFLKRVTEDVLRDCEEDLAFFNQRIDDSVLESLHTIRDNSFERVSYTNAIEILTSSGQEFEFPVSWGADLQSEHERFLTEVEFKRPVIVHDYPAAIKPFYMRVNEPDDEGRLTVRAMDVLAPKVGEIIGGSQREERLDVLQSRMAEQEMDPEHYWWYSDLRKYGTVPHSGFGLGFERIVQFMTGMANIRDVIPFPRTPGNCEF